MKKLDRADRSEMHKGSWKKPRNLSSTGPMELDEFAVSTVVRHE